MGLVYYPDLLFIGPHHAPRFDPTQSRAYINTTLTSFFSLQQFKIFHFPAKLQCHGSRRRTTSTSRYLSLSLSLFRFGCLVGKKIHYSLRKCINLQFLLFCFMKRIILSKIFVLGFDSTQFMLTLAPIWFQIFESVFCSYLIQ